MQFNIASLRHKVNELELFLSERRIDVLCLCEHSLRAEEILSTTIEGFSLASAFSRTIYARGGAAIYVAKDLEFKEIDSIIDLSVEKEAEFCCAYVRKFGLYIISIYRSPSGDLDRFCHLLEVALNRVGLSNRVVVAGDFNFHFNARPNVSDTLSDFLKTYGFCRTFFTQTRGGNCIDNVFVNFESISLAASSVDVCLSDHLAQVLSVLPINTMGNNNSAKGRMCRPITQRGKVSFFNQISSVCWRFVDDAGISVDDKFDKFIDVIRRQFNIAFPTKFCVVKNVDKKNGFQLDENLLNLREMMRLAGDLYRQHPSPSLLLQRNRLRYTYRSALKRARIAYNDGYINESVNKTSAMWKVIRGISNRNKHSSNDKVPIPPQTFNHYFANIALDLQKTLDARHLTDSYILDSYLGDAVAYDGCPFSFREVTFIEVREVIMGLKSTAGADIYDLNAGLIKQIREMILYPLTKLLNLAISSSIFPSALKKALVIPIYKNKGDRGDPGNYRPISLLPVISKIFERLISRQIYDFFECNNLFTTYQHGFRKGHNTVSAVYNFVSVILSAFEDKNYACAVFYDLTKAFDCVPHDLLLKKLKLYNFEDASVALIKSYLICRTQIVRVDGITSDDTLLSIGVPQGAILAPLLFLIYINDLPKNIVNTFCTCSLYADDTTVLNTASNLTELALGSGGMRSRVNDWFSMHRLIVNDSKQEQLIFSLKSDIDSDQNPVRFLGVYLSHDLSWRAHIDHLSGKLASSVYLLRNLSDRVSESVLRTSYFALCHSLLSYAILLWGHAADSKKVFALQRRAVRVVAGRRYREDCRSSFIDLRILTLPCIFILENLLFVRNNLTNYAPNNIYHSYDTRNSEALLIPFFRLKKCQNGPNFLAIKLFNRLPTFIQHLPLKQYKNVLRDALMGKAYYSIEEFLQSDDLLGVAAPATAQTSF